jgi:hypothetical protein
MTDLDAKMLADTAAVVLKHGLDGRTFPDYVSHLEAKFNRDAAAPVRHFAALVRFRKPWLTPRGVAGMLWREAAQCGTERRVTLDRTRSDAAPVVQSTHAHEEPAGEAEGEGMTTARPGDANP